MAAFTKNSLDTRMAQHLLNVSMCYRYDLIQYAMQYGTDNGIRDILNKREKEGYFIRIEIEKKKKSGDNKSYDAIALTKSGKIAVLNALGMSEREYRPFIKEKEKAFRTMNANKLRSELMLSRIETMFALASVKVFPIEKPSLYHLYTSLKSLGSDYDPNLDNLLNYNDSLTTEQCEQMLNNEGIFYTMKEVRTFLDQMHSMDSDDTIQSRAKGVFIRNDKLLIVYCSDRGDNKLIKINSTAEKRLISKLKIFNKITEIDRPIPSLSKKRKSQYTDEILIDNLIEGHPYALVISDDDSLVYSMATGNPNGIIKNVDMMEMDKARSARKKERGSTSIVSWLKGDGSIFPRIFVTPFTQYGVGSLNYLCHTTAEEWGIASQKLFGSSKNFEIDTYDPFYPAYEKAEWSRRSIFMPVFEVNELYTIACAKYTPTILTYSDMLDAIAHSIRKEATYYNADNMKRFDKDDVLIYDEYGYPKGYHMMELALKQDGYKCSRKELNNLPALQGYKFISFYNEIARGSIDLDRFLPSLNTKEIEEKKSKKVRRKRISLCYGEEFVNAIRKASKLYNMSVNSYIRSRMYDVVHKDAQAYDEKLKDSKNNWRNNSI